MINLDSELAGEYLAGSREYLAKVQAGLLALQSCGAEIDQEQVNCVLRAIHTIAGGANYFHLVKIGELARQTEGVLSLVHSRKMVLTPDRVRVLLTAAAQLRDLIQNPGTSNQADISQLMAALAGMSGDRGLSTEMAIGPVRHHLPNETPAGGMRLRMLLVEDDFASRLLLQTFLSTYGECHIAVNGKEAVDAVRVFMEQGRRYDLICMDIMMPEMDGREAVHQVRALEEKNGIPSTFGSKIIMTTAVEDMKEVIRCFNELCDGYLMKPIDLNQLRAQMKSCQLIQ